MTSPIGNQIANYVLDASLWESSLGTVYRAKHLSTRDEAAVFLVHPEVCQQIPIKRHFLEAVRAVENLEHPSIVSLYEAGQINGRYFAIMPAFEGSNLGVELQRQLQEGTTLQLEEALLLIAQLAEAIGYAHQKNVIHKTINPWSILIKRQPQAAGFPLRAMIYDLAFGHLQHKLLEINPERLKQTLPYYSPEQTLGQTVDTTTDIFALGVILYQLLTAQVPFAVAETTDAILLHLNETPQAPRCLQDDIPEIVEALMMKMIHKKREYRYQSGTIAAAALRNCALQLSNQPTTKLRDNVVSLRAKLPEAEIDRLFIYGQDETARIYPLDKRVIIIGRSRTSDIRLPAEGISRHHVRLEQTEQGWQVLDLNSTNGSFIEDQPMRGNEAYFWQRNKALQVGPYLLKWK
ncbi:MAG: FHA domain-containing serine/threonine-protein kinase [Chloroflexota bacterium]